jgi:hypothetical protein
MTDYEDAEKQIVDCLLSYTRGIDRLDPDAILAAFHPGALLEGYQVDALVPIEDFALPVVERLRKRYSSTQHRLSNTKIDFNDDRAIAESYILAYHVQPADEDSLERLWTFSGRYIDYFEDRDGQWRIAKRFLRADWTRIETIDEKMPNKFIAGTRDENDPIYG